MKTVRNILIVLFLGFSIVVGLNLELFIEKTSNFIYVVSGQEERDLAEKREKEKIRKWNEWASDIRIGLDKFYIYEKDILSGMESLVTQEKLNKLFPLKVSTTYDEDVYENICIETSYKKEDRILIKNNSSVAVKSLRIGFKAYNDDKNLVYEDDSRKFKFEYFLEPGDSQLLHCGYLSITIDEYEKLKGKKAIFKYEVIGTSEHSQKYLPEISRKPCRNYEKLLPINDNIFKSSSRMEYLKENYPELHERIPAGGFDIKQNLLDFCSKY